MNDVLRGILSRNVFDNQNMPLPTILSRVVAIYNRRISPTGYSLFFLLFGTQTPEAKVLYPKYTREATDGEEYDWAYELASSHRAPVAQSLTNSLKASRAKTREYLQESKALLRTFSSGDWVLRVRQTKQKFEPLYDGPWAIAVCHINNT